MSEAIVRRDMLKLERQALERMVAAMSTRHLRFGRNEVKFVATIGQARVRQEIDRLSKEWRELDCADSGSQLADRGAHWRMIREPKCCRSAVD